MILVLHGVKHFPNHSVNINGGDREPVMLQVPRVTGERAKVIARDIRFKLPEQARVVRNVLSQWCCLRAEKSKDKIFNVYKVDTMFGVGTRET